MARTSTDFLFDNPNSYLNIGKSETLTYHGNGTFVRRCIFDPIAGMIKGRVNNAGTHVVAGGIEYKLKTASRNHTEPGKELYFLPASRKFQGEYWAKNTEPADDPERCKKDVSEYRLEPQPISGGLLIAKSPSENVDYIPGPQGGVSAGHRTNIWTRSVIVLWNNGTLEEFFQEWHAGKNPKACIKGKGIRLTQKEMLARIANGELLPFKKYAPRNYLPTGGANNDIDTIIRYSLAKAQ